MPSTFILNRSKSLIDLNALVDANKEAMGERYVHLMETPEDRDMDIVRDSIGYLMARYADEVDDNELAIEFATDLVGFAVLPFATISEVPLPVRGVMHSTGAALVSAISARQAWLETVGIEALTIGDAMGRENKAAASRMSTGRKRTMAKEGGLKKTIAELSKPPKDDTVGE